eukprot:5512289-Alexandrium_andersonii.AAC.1
MSASLVGSEMCIRDSLRPCRCRSRRSRPLNSRWTGDWSPREQAKSRARLILKAFPTHAYARARAHARARKHARARA